MSDDRQEMERIAKAHPGVTKVIRVDEHVRLLDRIEELEASEARSVKLMAEAADFIEARAKRIEELEAAVRRLDSEGRLDCVVAGKTTNDGRPAPLCPEIIGNPALMCAGCACPRPAALGDNDE